MVERLFKSCVCQLMSTSLGMRIVMGWPVYAADSMAELRQLRTDDGIAGDEEDMHESLQTGAVCRDGM